MLGQLKERQIQINVLENAVKLQLFLLINSVT